MNWTTLSSTEQLDQLIERSFQRPQVIFKHSTRCTISSMALNRLERAETPEEADFHYLDLIQYRPLSNLIAEKFNVYHESPQVLIIHNGECTYDESHYAISMEEIKGNLTF